MNTIEFQVVPNDDVELNCFFCHSQKACEFAMILYGMGSTSWMGIHEACLFNHRGRFVRKHHPKVGP